MVNEKLKTIPNGQELINQKDEHKFKDKLKSILKDMLYYHMLIQFLDITLKKLKPFQHKHQKVKLLQTLNKLFLLYMVKKV